MVVSLQNSLKIILAEKNKRLHFITVNNTVREMLGNPYGFV